MATTPPNRTSQIITNTLIEEADPEVDRMLVSDALVIREGSHYRIESGGEDPDELPDVAPPLCDCGQPLPESLRCPSCQRRYRL